METYIIYVLVNTNKIKFEIKKSRQHVVQNDLISKEYIIGFSILPINLVF
jgi:hypothetical protein